MSINFCDLEQRPVALQRTHADFNALLKLSLMSATSTHELVLKQLVDWVGWWQLLRFLSRPPAHRQSKLKVFLRIISSRPRRCRKRRRTLSSPGLRWRTLPTQ